MKLKFYCVVYFNKHLTIFYLAIAILVHSYNNRRVDKISILRIYLILIAIVVRIEGH